MANGIALKKEEKEREKGAGNGIDLEGKKMENERNERATALPWNGRRWRMREMSGQWHCPGTEEEKGNKQNETQKGE